MSAPSIRLSTFRELWIHTGTACNLECPFCLEGSKPGDTRLERVTLNDLKPYLDDAARRGVTRFCFTGGEPLIVKDIVKILSYALTLRPCLVLTNGTAPLIKRAHQLAALKSQPHALSFTVSIDSPDEARHDSQRGWGNFKRAIEGVKVLHRSGFAVSIAHHIEECPPEETQARFRELLRKHDLPEHIGLAALPEFGRPNTSSEENPVKPEELTNRASDTLCAGSRMLLKRGGELRVYACALTDDDTRFDLGTSFDAALGTAVPLVHHRCRQCLRFGSTLGA